MTINLHIPSQNDTLRPKLTVIGVGGAGGNAVNNMIAANLEGVDFVMANTDAQALEASLTNRTIQLGVNATRGLGAGASPEVGRNAAEEAIEELADFIAGSNMVFITAGMGGGTGTGAAPVIAELAKEQGILTVGVVTRPFHFEGTHRMRIADSGIEELQQFVDTLIVIPNQNLFRIANEKTTFADAFRMADEVLHSGVRGVTDLMVKPGLVNLDFADIRAVMSEMGKAMMGTGEATSEKRAIDAAEAAISNPLLDDVSLNGARAVLINITGGPDMTLFEVDEAANRIRDEVDTDANIIFGSTFSDAMEGKMRVSVVATGIDSESMQQPAPVSVGRLASAQPVKAGLSAPAAKSAAGQRTAADIVRDSGKASVAEVARQRAQQKTESEARTKSPVVRMRQASAESKAAFVKTAASASPSSMQEQMDIEEMVGVVQEDGAADGSAAADEAAVFISPRAQHPTRRPQSADTSPQMQESEEEEDGSGASFFQKIAGVGKALAARPEPQKPASRANVVEKPSAATGAEEDYLDIPAFLRRQAN